MNGENSRSQSKLLLSIVVIIAGILVLVGLDKQISDMVAAMLNTTLSGLIGALGGHAIASSQANNKTPEKTNEPVIN